MVAIVVGVHAQRPDPQLVGGPIHDRVVAIGPGENIADGVGRQRRWVRRGEVPVRGVGRRRGAGIPVHLVAARRETTPVDRCLPGQGQLCGARGCLHVARRRRQDAEVAAPVHRHEVGLGVAVFCGDPDSNLVGAAGQGERRAGRAAGQRRQVVVVGSLGDVQPCGAVVRRRGHPHVCVRSRHHRVVTPLVGREFRMNADRAEVHAVGTDFHRQAIQRVIGGLRLRRPRGEQACNDEYRRHRKGSEYSLIMN